jgi:hypothetical protein
VALPHLAAPFSQPRPRTIPWDLELVAGRLVEVAGREDTAVLTLTCGLILNAQQNREQVAWVTPLGAPFFPPDLNESGIEHNALVVVRVGDAAAGARAADKLIRSGSFGMVVVDAGSEPRIPTPLLARLASLAQRNHAAVVFLTKHSGAPASTPTKNPSAAHTDSASSLGSLISLRVRARRQRIAADRFRCWIEVRKDKRRGPTWEPDEVCRGAPGMR